MRAKSRAAVVRDGVKVVRYAYPGLIACTITYRALRCVSAFPGLIACTSPASRIAREVKAITSTSHIRSFAMRIRGRFRVSRARGNQFDLAHGRSRSVSAYRIHFELTHQVVRDAYPRIAREVITSMRDAFPRIVREVIISSSRITVGRSRDKSSMRDAYPCIVR